MSAGGNPVDDGNEGGDTSNQQEIASSMSPQLSSGEIHASMSAGGNPVDDGNEGGDTGAIHASMSAGGNPVDDGNEGGDTSNVLFTFFPECVGFCSVLCLKILLLEKCPKYYYRYYYHDGHKE
ncbi:hypothetical protein ACFE04_002371 [Oxalis oulophora]